ncbi:MAG: hypothetical protein JNM17_34970 [Archangium sp.]|nr:hypothetical protein [Archangium sp.]
MKISSLQRAFVPQQSRFSSSSSLRSDPQPRSGSSFEAASSSASRLVSAPKGPPPVFTGFDATKLSEPLKLQADGQPKSAKYTFAKLAQASGEMPRSKAEAELWFKQHIQGGLEEAGFAVGWVKGDKALICTRENPQGEVVDFLRGADSNDPSYQALAWQPEGGGSGGAAPVGGAPAASMATPNWRATLDEILAELAKEQLGDVPADQRDAILAQVKDAFLAKLQAKGIALG